MSDKVIFRAAVATAGIVNGNGDYFDYKELKKAYKSFVNTPVRTGYQPTDLEVGKVLDASMEGDKVIILAEIDTGLAAVKPGAWLGYCVHATISECSICHVRASKYDELCEHLKEGFSPATRPSGAHEIIRDITALSLGLNGAEVKKSDPSLWMHRDGEKEAGK